jgi:hypothetical protein
MGKFWGHKDGEKRMGFKPEVVSALWSLAQVHNIEK